MLFRKDNSKFSDLRPNEQFSFARMQYIKSSKYSFNLQPPPTGSDGVFLIFLESTY